MNKPDISIIVINYNMARELPRTLYTLFPPYQKGICAEQVEIIVIDNGSTQEIKLPENIRDIRLLKFDNPTPSPVSAINYGISIASANLIGVMIDGARMASPGLCQLALRANRLADRCIISTLGFHLGPKVQMESVKEGYCQEIEDRLLESISWEKNGYELFNISVFAGSSASGWFNPIAESNALFMRRNLWKELGGYDKDFQSPGGGLANLDVYMRACELKNTLLVTLLGEGTFHQFHGGIATNQNRKDANWQTFHDEYKRLRGKNFTKPMKDTIYLGYFNSKCLKSFQTSIDHATSSAK